MGADIFAGFEGIGGILAIEGLVELGMAEREAVFAAPGNGAMAAGKLSEFGAREVSLRSPLASPELHDRAAFEGRSGSEWSTVSAVRKPLHRSRGAAILCAPAQPKNIFRGTCFGAGEVLGCLLRLNLQWSLKTQPIGWSRADIIDLIDVAVGAGGSLIWCRADNLSSGQSQ